jgi:hypothetical protein
VLPTRPLYARLPDGTDPADLLALAGPTALSEALAAARPLAEQLIDERLKTCHPLTLCWKQPGWLPPGHPPTGTSAAISSRLGIPTVQVCRALRTLANEWNIDPRQAAEQPLQTLGEVKRRISKAIEDPGEPRRTAPTRRLDQPHQPDPRQRATRTGPNRR